MKTLLLSIIFTAVACLGAYKLGFNHAEKLFAWHPVQER